MKRLLLILLVVPFFGTSQVRTSTAAGDFLNPLIWNPIGIPTNGDSLVINHAIVMNTGIYYTSGQILINGSGSLMEDGIDRAMYIDGGSLVNHGTFKSHHLWVASNGYITNTGNIVDIDSMLNQAMYTNTGTISVFDFANDEMATYINNGALTVTSNFHNQGLITSTGTIDVANDFSNCNTQNLDALFINDGAFCIGNDFLNCGGDTMSGFGSYFIGNLSTNLGVFSGTHNFYTNTGSLSLNTGVIDSGVTFAVGTCNLIVDENELLHLDAYPNPVKNTLSISMTNVEYTLTDIAGKIIQTGIVENGTIDMQTVSTGSYFLSIPNAQIVKVIKH